MQRVVPHAWRSGVLHRAFSSQARPAAGSGVHLELDADEQRQVKHAPDEGKKLARPSTPGSAREHKMPDLTQPLPAFEDPSRWTRSPQSKDNQTMVSTLGNGVRVASCDSFGQVAALSVWVDTGARYEDDSNCGVSHMLQGLAFKTTEQRSAHQVIQAFEQMGGVVGSSSGLEQILYLAEVQRSHVADAMKLLSEVVLFPSLTPEDLEDVRATCAWEREMLAENPAQLVPNMLHAVAFDDKTLGRPVLGPPETLKNIDARVIREFTKRHFCGGNIVVAAAGVPHDEFVSIAQETFGIAPTLSLNVPKREASEYRPATRRLVEIPSATMTHVALGLQSVSWYDPQLYAVCLLHMMLGGGGSFSSGGPGKGMYTRLYTNVLNRYHWVETATATHQCYTDNGLFSIYGVCQANKADELVSVLYRELTRMATVEMGPEEFQRTQNALISSLMMNLESRSVLCEDIGHQVLRYGQRFDPAEIIANVRALTPRDVTDAAVRLLRSPVSFAAWGDTSRIPASFPTALP